MWKSCLSPAANMAAKLPSAARSRSMVRGVGAMCGSQRATTRRPFADSQFVLVTTKSQDTETGGGSGGAALGRRDDRLDPERHQRLAALEVCRVAAAGDGYDRDEHRAGRAGTSEFAIGRCNSIVGSASRGQRSRQSADCRERRLNCCARSTAEADTPIPGPSQRGRASATTSWPSTRWGTLRA